MAERVHIVNTPEVDLGMMGFVFFFGIVAACFTLEEVKDHHAATNDKLDRIIQLMEAGAEAPAPSSFEQ